MNKLGFFHTVRTGGTFITKSTCKYIRSETATYLSGGIGMDVYNSWLLGLWRDYNDDELSLILDTADTYGRDFFIHQHSASWQVQEKNCQLFTKARAKGIRFFTVVRDPVEQLFSLYNYFGRHVRYCKVFEGHLKKYDISCAEEFIEFALTYSGDIFDRSFGLFLRGGDSFVGGPIHWAIPEFIDDIDICIDFNRLNDSIQKALNITPISSFKINMSTIKYENTVDPKKYENTIYYERYRECLKRCV